ncbi:MAG: Gfo/Idh/MocA family oxidoreductase [Deltaproteobacteria bacterium]|nr:Gfo/Idh/MocA family oxidoreductase [Deltaproteobacteria bacterium]
MRPRRTALLGFGHVAEHGHLPAWLARQDFTLVAVAEPDPARRAIAAARLPDAHVYADATALFAAEARIDAVDIAAPPALHAPLAIAAARAGANILCEKPLATTPDDFRAMRAAARAAGVALVTVHNWKHSAQFGRLAALLGDGAVGRLQRIRIETIRAGRAVSVGSEWRGDARLAGGGILVDHGWHALYLLIGLAGERPSRIRATVERRRYTSADVEDTADCEVEFPSMRGEIFLTWAGEARATRWQVQGSDGRVTLADDRGTLEADGASRPLAFDGSLSEGSHHPDWFDAVIDDFAAEIDDPARRGRNLAEAESCVLLTALAYQSSAQGGASLPVPRELPE